jgi:hypothetical protein
MNGEPWWTGATSRLTRDYRKAGAEDFAAAREKSLGNDRGLVGRAKADDMTNGGTAAR